MTYPQPENESRRLAVLESYEILDTLPERDYDDIVELASRLCESPVALLSLVDGDRQWFKARKGLDDSETPREQAFCAHAICEPDSLTVVNDATADDRFRGNPLVTASPGIRFYAGAPLVSASGEALGTICVIDHKPRTLTDGQAAALRSLSRLVMSQFEMRRSLATMERLVLDQEGQVESLLQREVETRATVDRLRRESLTDVLSGLWNRRGLEQKLDGEFNLATRYQLPLSLMVIDMDYFNSYNDSFGHAEGDRALAILGKILKRTKRNYDVAARFGGEEFVIVMPGTSEQGARVLAERVRRNVQRHAWPKRAITVSIGTASVDPGMSTGNALFEAADAALYDAKAGGRDRCVHAAPASGRALHRIAANQESAR
ncbi:MAG: sensor domain-containing diguanylate cyclase [Woeseiaceae bacterium]|nr:sensor domain-containing diguanylate cyclase [Woeseiaceae bacterium]